MPRSAGNECTIADLLKQQVCRFGDLPHMHQKYPKFNIISSIVRRPALNMEFEFNLAKHAKMVYQYK